MASLTITAVSICNSALIKLGADPIVSIDQDTKNAQLCNARYAFLRNKVLEDHPWYFATKTVELAAIVGTPIMDWTHQYQLPADYIKMIRAEDWKQDFEILDGYLHANDVPIKIKYIWENTNEGTWSYSFAECLAWRLAADLSYNITKSLTVAKTMMEGYDMDLKAARYNDSHKKSPENFVSDSYIDIRN